MEAGLQGLGGGAVGRQLRDLGREDVQGRGAAGGGGPHERGQAGGRGDGGGGAAEVQGPEVVVEAQLVGVQGAQELRLLLQGLGAAEAVGGWGAGVRWKGRDLQSFALGGSKGAVGGGGGGCGGLSC